MLLKQYLSYVYRCALRIAAFDRAFRSGAPRDRQCARLFQRPDFFCAWAFSWTASLRISTPNLLATETCAHSKSVLLVTQSLAIRSILIDYYSLKSFVFLCNDSKYLTNLTHKSVNNKLWIDFDLKSRIVERSPGWSAS